jgi:ATP/maltotriose-dependent transcriptional regulator MalT/DNA-binding XRE family transcriptional regulator
MVTRRVPLPDSSVADFGGMLRVLRHRARLTQRELGLAVGYSEAQISRLEKGKRLPDPSVVAALFLPSLGLANDPELAARLHRLAETARATGDALPAPADPGHPTVGAAPPAIAGDLADIPAAPQPNVHRAAEAAALAGLLATRRHVLVIGAPGMGKTSLAADAARQRARRSGVCWLTLTAGITTPAEAVIRRLARFLARHGETEVLPLLDLSKTEHPLPRDEQLHLIATALGRACPLICLDNAQLLGAEPETMAVIGHLAAAPGARFLAMSREELPLDGFEVLRLGGLADGEARTLIGQVAGRTLPDPLVARLIGRTAASPILIRLALGRLRADDPDPAALIETLETQPEVSAYLLQTTLGGLSEPSRRLISVLAVFRHPVDLLNEQLVEACEELDGPFDVAAGLAELRRRQLVGHAARASLHPLVHDHVFAWLVGSTAGRRRLHRLAARHCEQVLCDPLEACWHFARAGDHAEAADLLAASSAGLTASGRSERAADLAAELLGSGRLTQDAVRQLCIARGDLLVHTERAAEAEAAYREALRRSVPLAVRAEVAWRLAQCLLQRGQVREALALCRDAAAELGEGDDVLRAHLAAVQSAAHLNLSEFAAAVTMAQAAGAIADRIEAITPGIASSVRARAYSVLGITARLRGDRDDAVRFLDRAVTAARACGLREAAGRALFNLGAIAYESGEPGRAELLYEEALAEARKIADGYGAARVLHALGIIQNNRGAAERALELFEESRALKQRIGDLDGAASSAHGRALVQLSLGRVAAARTTMVAVLAASEDLGERRSRAYFLDSAAMIALVEEDLDAAWRFIAESAAAAAGMAEPYLLASIASHRALAALAAGDIPAARRDADQAAEQISRAGPGVSAGALDARAVTACVALAGGDPAGAAAAAATLAEQAASVGFMLWERAAQRIAAMATAAQAGTGPADPRRYPALIYVDRPRADGGKN